VGTDGDAGGLGRPRFVLPPFEPGIRACPGWATSRRALARAGVDTLGLSFDTLENETLDRLVNLLAVARA
jgi:hypothetical protein